MRKTKGGEREMLTNREASLWICNDEMKLLEKNIRE
jgi:hypothetical protein